MTAQLRALGTGNCLFSRFSTILRPLRAPMMLGRFSPISWKAFERRVAEVGQALDTQRLTALKFRLTLGSPSVRPPEAYPMTKADLVERVTAQIARTAGPMISKKDCARVVDSFLDAIKQALQEQKNIEVRGFGTFKIRHRKTRMARNPRTGSPVEVSARPVPVFKPSKELRAMVAGIDIANLEEEDETELSNA